MNLKQIKIKAMNKLEQRIDKLENRMDAVWRSIIEKSINPLDKISDDCKITFKGAQFEKGSHYRHNIYHNLKAVCIQSTGLSRSEAVIISEDKNCASEAFKIGNITEIWIDNWTKVEN